MTGGINYNRTTVGAGGGGGAADADSEPDFVGSTKSVHCLCV